MHDLDMINPYVMNKWDIYIKAIAPIQSSVVDSSLA